MKLSALIAAIAVCSTLATASYAQPRKDTLEQAPPDFVADVLGKLVVAGLKCGLQTNNFPLKRAVAKLGWDSEDFKPDQLYGDLVERSIDRALARVFGPGAKPQACAEIKSEVAQSLPDIIAERR